MNIKLIADIEKNLSDSLTELENACQDNPEMMKIIQEMNKLESDLWLIISAHNR